jgi:hypothetical protein
VPKGSGSRRRVEYGAQASREVAARRLVLDHEHLFGAGGRAAERGLWKRAHQTQGEGCRRHSGVAQGLRDLSRCLRLLPGADEEQRRSSVPLDLQEPAGAPGMLLDALERLGDTLLDLHSRALRSRRGRILVEHAREQRGSRQAYDSKARRDRRGQRAQTRPAQLTAHQVGGETLVDRLLGRVRDKLEARTMLRSRNADHVVNARALAKRDRTQPPLWRTLTQAGRSHAGQRGPLGDGRVARHVGSTDRTLDAEQRFRSREDLESLCGTGVRLVAANPGHAPPPLGQIL